MKKGFKKEYKERMIFSCLKKYNYQEFQGMKKLKSLLSLRKPKL